MDDPFDVVLSAESPFQILIKILDCVRVDQCQEGETPVSQGPIAPQSLAYSGRGRLGKLSRTLVENI